jgi:glycosyltransferase involved in cell wall biosynthesis
MHVALEVRDAQWLHAMNILHVAQIEIARTSGMGRVAWHWRAELERRGHRFIHIGREPLGRETHPALYPFAAWAAARRLRSRPDLVLAHEPASAVFARHRPPLIVFSHGVERRGWSIAKQYRHLSGERIKLRSQLTFPIWRLLACDYGLRHAAGALVLNREDYVYCLDHYKRRPESTFQFRNGVDPVVPLEVRAASVEPTVLFLGTWIPRKGIRTLVDAATLLHARGIRPRWLLAGTGVEVAEVLALWPRRLHEVVEVVPAFEPGSETALFSRATVFVLPSFFEGQPLSLLQAMASGLPVIGSDICGQHDLLTHGENSLLFSPGDAAALADQITACLQDAELRMRLGAAAQKFVAGRSWESAAAEVADFIEHIYLASKKASAVA